jgi:hypothetical protein
LPPVSRRRVLLIASVLVGLLVIWHLRVLGHWFAMFLWTAPLVWLPPSLLLAAGAVVIYRSPHGLRWMRAGANPRARLFVLPALALPR